MAKFILEITVGDHISIEEIKDELQKILTGKMHSPYTEEDMQLTVYEETSTDDKSVEEVEVE